MPITRTRTAIRPSSSRSTRPTRILGDAAKKKAYDESQSVALVTNLDEVAMTVIEDYFSQFQQPPHPTHE